MKQLTLEEQHEIILGIAKAFANICETHNIPYYMLGGTMLGAVRHQGFIPWDDDMDFGIPRPFYAKAIELLENELQKPYRCCTYRNHKGCRSAFMKIENINTAINDPRVKLPIEEQLGLNIDVFPLDYCDENNSVLKKINRLMLLQQTIYVGNMYGSPIKNGLKKILSLICPISHNKMLDKANALLAELPEGKCLANVFGRWGSKEIIPIEWYGEKVKYKFEDSYFCGLKEFDKYLQKLYNNYMQLPPENKRVAHADIAFLR